MQQYSNRDSLVDGPTLAPAAAWKDLGWGAVAVVGKVVLWRVQQLDLGLCTPDGLFLGMEFVPQ